MNCGWRSRPAWLGSRIATTTISPTVSVDGPSFTTLFTGFRSALKLAREGALFGRPDAAQLCNLAFAGPLPWVAEHF